MKKIFTLIIFAVGISSAFAQWQQNPQQRGGPQPSPNYPGHNDNYNQYASLIVTSGMQRQFSVNVDNRQYQGNDNNGSGNTINIGQLDAGNHNIVIYQWKTNFWGKQVQETVYNSSLYLKPGFETTIFINGIGQVNISERQVYNNDDQGYGNNGNGVGYGYGRNKNKNKNKHKKDHDDKDDDDRNNNRNRKEKERKDKDKDGDD